MTERYDESRASSLSIDEPSMREIMSYYGIDNHDELVKYINSLGIQHKED